MWFALVLVIGLAVDLSGPPGARAAAETASGLLPRPWHLRSGDVPEWDDYAGRASDGRRLDLSFAGSANAGEGTLLVRQDDVRQDWVVEVNGRRLGKLFLMEGKLEHALAIPARTLRDGTNLLSVLPPRENDDIFLESIRVDLRPRVGVLTEASLVVNVEDEKSGQALPGRLTVVHGDGALAAVWAPSNAPPMALRPGVIYTGSGEARFGLQAGDYTIYASRGLEWSVATQRVQLARGEAGRIRLSLRREVPTPGWVSCDTHVHTVTHSGHGDCTLEERMLTLAGEGIELPISTDHNFHTDPTEPAARLGVAGYFTPVTGNEVTTAAGHFNVFPVEPSARVPDFRLTHWPALMKSVRETPGVRVVVLNHPRNVHNNFQPFASSNYHRATGQNRRGPEFSFDAIELLNSSAQQSDYMLVYGDWFGLLNHGYRITAVGSSDSHDVSRYIVGQGRTYIAGRDDQPGRVDIAAACSNLVAGRALVSMGLMVEMTVDGRYEVGDLARGLSGTLAVQVRVLGPSWVGVTNLTLYANGEVLWEQSIASDSSTPALGPGERAVVARTFPRPAHDVHLVAIAVGPAVTAPFWAIPRPYQPTSRRWAGRVIGSTNPIWVDADGDGRFTAARGYAQQLVRELGTEPEKLVSALGRYDSAVAAQAASLCAEAGQVLDSPEWRRVLESARPPVRSGFARYAEGAR